MSATKRPWKVSEKGDITGPSMTTLEKWAYAVILSYIGYLLWHLGRYYELLLAN